MASNIDIIVGATVDGALGGLRAVDSAINRLQPAAAAIGKVGKAAFAAIAAGIGIATTALTYFVNEASKAQEVDALFNAVFDSAAASQFTEEVTIVTKEIEKYYNKLGQARYRVSYVTETTTAVRGLDEAFKDTIISIADAASQITRFDDEAIKSAASQLLLYGEIGQDVFGRVLETSLDLAEVMKTDATSAAETLGRALADVEGGSLSLLKRQRLLTDEQVKTAEAMAETGDIAGAQAYVLDILDGKIGDLAETMGKTFSGQVAILKNNFGNLAEDLGSRLLPVLVPVVAKFAELVEKYGPKIGAFFDAVLVPALKNAVKWFTDFIDTLSSGNFNLKEWLLGIDWGALSDQLVTAMDSIDWNAVGNAIGEGLKVAFEVGKSIVQDTNWDELFSSLWEAIEGIGEGISGALGGSSDWDAMWSGIFDNAASIAENAKARIVAAFWNLPSLIGAVAGGMMSYWAIGILNGAAIAVNAVRSVVTKIITAFRSKLSQFRAIGKAILDGIKAGITSGWDAFASWLEGIVMSIVQSVLDALGISSPSKVFADIGKQMMAGMAQGIARNVSMPMASMQMATAGVMGVTHNVNNSYYYGAKLMLAQGQEGQILSTLTE